MVTDFNEQSLLPNNNIYTLTIGGVIGTFAFIIGTSTFRCIVIPLYSAGVVDLRRVLVMANLPGLATSSWVSYMALLHLQFNIRSVDSTIWFQSRTDLDTAYYP
jgi:hypothetical protein